MSGTFLLDGQPVPFEPGQTILEAARAAGRYIPHLCWHPDFPPHGSCKLCIVKVAGRHVSGCAMPAKEGWEVESDTPEMNGERRALPLGEQPLALLRERAKVRRIDSDWVFPGRLPGQPAQFRHAWETALQTACIEDFRWHDLRHSAASYLAMNGASHQEIAAILGHRTLAMVKRYSHLSESHVAGVVGRMNAKIFGE